MKEIKGMDILVPLHRVHCISLPSSEVRRPVVHRLGHGLVALQQQAAEVLLFHQAVRRVEAFLVTCHGVLNEAPNVGNHPCCLRLSKENPKGKPIQFGVPSKEHIKPIERQAQPRHLAPKIKPRSCQSSQFLASFKGRTTLLLPCPAKTQTPMVAK